MSGLFKKKNPEPVPEFRRAKLPPRKDEAIPIVSVSHFRDDDISQAVALFCAPVATHTSRAPGYMLSSQPHLFYEQEKVD